MTTPRDLRFRGASRPRTRGRAGARPLFLGPFLSIGALVAAGFLFSAPAAAQGGAHLERYGWWLITNYDPTATAPYKAPDEADPHVGYGPNPDAAEKQDTSGPVNGATEISAARYALPDKLPDGTVGSIPIGTLVLPVDTQYTPAVSPQASILACASLNPWSEAQGGNWQVRDTYDTGGACSAGTYDSKANTFTFSIIAEMAQAGQFVDIALVPGFIPISSSYSPDPSNPPQASWTVDLKPPTDSMLTLLPVSSTSVPGGLGVPQESAATVPSLGSGSLPAGGVPALGPAGVPAPSGKTQPGYHVPTGLAANPAARLDALGRGRLVAGTLLLLLFLGGLLVMALDVQRLLTPAGQAAGIGRFARPRMGPPLPI